MYTRKITKSTSGLFGVLGLFSLFFVAFFLGEKVLPAIGQSSEEPVMVWENYTPPPTIHDIAVDSNYIWAATEGGIIRWNKNDSTFLKYLISTVESQNRILSVAIDTYGNKWFGTAANEIIKFNGNQWIIYVLPDGYTVPTISIHPNGNILFGTNGGVLVFNGQNFSRLPNDGIDPSSPGSIQISAIAVDLLQNIWVGSYNSGTFKLSGNKWKHYGDPSLGPGGSVRDIEVSSSGDIWFAFDASFNGSVGRFTNNTWIRYSTSDGLVSDYGQSLSIDSSGYVWAGFSDGSLEGIAKFDGSKWTKISLNQKTGLPFSRVSKIRSDNLGQMWFVSANYLITFDGGNDWKIFLAGLPILPLLPSPKIGIAPNKDIWFSVYRSGVVKYDGITWQMYTRADGLAGELIEDIVADKDGNMWFATWKDEGYIVGAGVSRFDGTTWTNFSTSDGLASHVVYDMAVDESGNVWFGTHTGLSKYDGDTWVTYTTADGLVTDSVWQVEASGNDIWIACGGGVTHFDGHSWTTYGESDGLSDNTIYAIDFDSLGNPWVATGRGVSHFDGNAWTNYPLPCCGVSWVTDMAVDASDSVWLGAYGDTWTGLNRLKDGTWKSFKTSNGLLSDEIDWIVADGHTIWFTQADKGVGRLEQFYGLNEKVYLPLVNQ